MKLCFWETMKAFKDYDYNVTQALPYWQQGIGDFICS